MKLHHLSKNIWGPRKIAIADNRGHLWGEQHRIETRTKRNHSRVNSGRLTIGGNYSRSPYLSFEQRRALMRRTIEFVDGRVPVMVGISHPSFKTAIELAHDAEKLGAAAVQLLAPLRPFAGPPTQADLVAYFEAIGRETSLPITLYLNPGPGADVSITDTIALAKLPRVQLIKESS